MSRWKGFSCWRSSFTAGCGRRPPGTEDARALQSGYEPLIRQVGTATARDIELIRQRHTLAADARDLLAARDSLKQLLRLSQLNI